jgi:hypothetical protein
MGQISGIAFIFCMSSFKSSLTGSMTKPLIVLICFMLLSIFLSMQLKESTLISKDKDLKLSDDPLSDPNLS